MEKIGFARDIQKEYINAMYKIKVVYVFFLAWIGFSVNALAFTPYLKRFKVEFFNEKIATIGMVSGEIRFILDDQHSMYDPIFKKGDILHFGFYDQNQYKECAVQVVEHIHMSPLFQKGSSSQKNDSDQYQSAKDKIQFNCVDRNYSVDIQPIKYLDQEGGIDGYGFSLQFFKKENGNTYLGRIYIPKLKLSEPSLD